MLVAKKGNELNHPFVFDPVGAGVSSESISSKINGNRHCRSNFPASLRYNRFSVFHRLGIRSADCNSNCGFLYFKERQRRKIV